MEQQEKNIKNKRNFRKKKKVKPVLILVFIAAILITFLVKYLSYQSYYKESLEPMAKAPGKDIKVIIPENSTVLTMGTILQDNGLIRDRESFRKYVRKEQVAEKLKAGSFTLNDSMSVAQIVEILTTSGHAAGIIKLTVPEGFELKQIAERLRENNIANADEFLKLASDKKIFEDKFVFLKQLPEKSGLEGYLFPATYDFYADADAKTVIEKMLTAFESVYKREIENDLKDTGLDLNQLVTLASIIEREGKTDEDRPKISSVFYNRIAKGMKLQSCATVQYILGERKSILTNADTAIDSPYNTYLYTGLPPTPIAAPGEKAILAALHPEKTEYLFFVLTGEDGSHTFSKTLDEHEKAKTRMVNP